MTAHLLVISIGPVQDFIAAGRKTRDLWFGSFVLGEVSRHVAKAVRQPGVELIFPDESAIENELPVANKVLAWAGPEIDPRALAAVARKAAQDQLDDCRNQALKRISWGVDVPLLKEHVANFLEFAAAWYPVEEETYKKSREEVELLLAGRKALRDFAPAHGRDGAPKSSLDPARESVIVWPDNTTDAERLRRGLKLKGAEQLDGVSLMKRLAEPRRFVSVARVAIDPFIHRAHRDTRSELEKLTNQATVMVDDRHPSVESFESKLSDGLEQYQDFPFDTQLFFDDGRGDPDLREGSWPERDKERTQARTFYEDADALRRKLDISELPTYFAVLKADGDYMGRAISSMDDRGKHRRLSQQLATFAGKADEIVQEHQGAMVYSGGDDVLAFLPLDRALDCADRLRHTFMDTMKGATGETPVSLSVGIAIGHYGEHLQRLLEWGREAERAAKAPRDPRHPKESARNGLAVSLHTRGAGEGRTVVHPWIDEPVTARWNRWVEWHRCDLIPDSAAYELSRIEREFRSLWTGPASAATEERRERLSELMRSEVARILGRRRTQHGAEAFAETRQKTLIRSIGKEPDALRRLADELLIARRIAAAIDVAEGPLDAETCKKLVESGGDDAD